MPQRFGVSLKKIARFYRVRIFRIWHVDKFVLYTRGPSGRRERGKKVWATR